jgi:hypothetical protein
MSLETMRLLRNILLRSFVIGIGFAIFFAVLTFGLWDWWMNFATKMAHTEPATFVPILLNFFVDIRFLLIFLVLTPALALHWTIKREQARLRRHASEKPSGRKHAMVT